MKLMLMLTSLHPFPLSAGRNKFSCLVWYSHLFFLSSDEEGEDSSALLYLPIAPDIEEPEDGFIPEPDSGSSPKRDQVLICFVRFLKREE